MTSHFSLNIKTLSKATNAVVLSMALVHFDRTNIIKTIEVGLTVEEQVAMSRHIETDRLLWWFDKHRNPITASQPDERFDPRSAIKRLNAFVLENGSIPDDPKIPVNFVWCRGTQFDWAILENLSHTFQVGLPFRHNAIKDQRTFCGPHIQHAPEKFRQARYDAIYHAQQIQKVLSKTGKELD